MSRALLPAYETLIEQRIREATERGDFEGLPGTGQPMQLDDDLLV
ncbi:MAG: DnaJ family domain-containing protein, partial [Betaproteobacteria bacterium]